MHAAWESESLLWSGAGADSSIAPLGQAVAQSPQAVHLAKSIVGNPNEGLEQNGSRSVRIPVRRLLVTIWSNNSPFQRSFPEYDRLKLLLITGKSGTMLPGTARTSAGQFLKLGSVILTRSSPPRSSVRIQ